MKLNQAQVAYQQGVTERTIRNWEESEGLPCDRSSGAPEYDDAACLSWRIERDTGGSYSAERTRLTKEQADKAEMENALNRGDLIERAEVVREVGGIIHAVKTRLLALPSQLSSYLANKDAADIQGQLTDAIYETLSELAEGDFESVPSTETVDSQ